METNQPLLLDVPEQIPGLAQYDWIVVSSSAGKDSLAMLDYIVTMAEAAGVLDRVVVVHADLGRVEWKGTSELAEAQAARYGVRYVRVWRRQGDLLQHIERMGFFPRPTTRYCTSDHKRDQIIKAFKQLSDETKIPVRDGDLLQQVEERGMWPSPQQRYCTSDQKRAQVHRVYTALTTKSGQKQARILSCQGMRAQESPGRAKRPQLEMDKRASNGKREVTNWLPLHRWTVGQVWERIRASRAADLVHPAYGLGMPRLSCVFCIFSPKAGLILAGKHNPELLAEYVRVEEEIGHRFRVDLSLKEVQEAVLAGETPAEVSDWTM